jgi:hypothetical protein
MCKGLKNLVCSWIYVGALGASGRVSMGEHIYNMGWKFPDLPDLPDLMGPSVIPDIIGNTWARRVGEVGEVGEHGVEL